MRVRNDIEMGGITLVWDNNFLGWRIPGRDDVERDKEKAARIALKLSKLVAKAEAKMVSDQTPEHSDQPIWERSMIRYVPNLV